MQLCRLQEKPQEFRVAFRELNESGEWNRYSSLCTRPRQVKLGGVRLAFQVGHSCDIESDAVGIPWLSNPLQLSNVANKNTRQNLCDFGTCQIYQDTSTQRFRGETFCSVSWIRRVAQSKG